MGKLNPMKERLRLFKISNRLSQRHRKRVRCIQTVMRYPDYNLVGCRQHVAIQFLYICRGKSTYECIVSNSFIDKYNCVGFFFFDNILLKIFCSRKGYIQILQDVDDLRTHG